ncbi:MAG: hypothetical protein ACM3X6_03220 [Patescibacteria group bacterium]
MHRGTLTVLALLIFAAALAAPIEGAGGFVIEDRETVYGLLDPGGTPKDLTVVDWLRVRGAGATVVVDPGDLTGVRNLKGPERPRRVPGGLAWDVKCRGGIKDIFYDGHTKKPLPVEIKIVYVLNGKVVAPGEVAGKKGDLAVRITITNKLRASGRIAYADAGGGRIVTNREFVVPMAANITIDVPSELYQRIEAPDATAIATGSTLKISWIVFPYPTARLTLRLVGERMRLEPFFFSIAPSELPYPSLPIEGRLMEMGGGVRQLYERFGAVVAGAEELVQGQDRLLGGVGRIQAGVADLSRLNEAHREIVARTASGLAKLNPDDLAATLGRLSELEDGLGRLEEGAGSLRQLNEAHQRIAAAISGELEAIDPAPLAQNLGRLDELAGGLEEADKYLGDVAESHAAQTAVARGIQARQGDILAKLDELGERDHLLRGSPEFKELQRLCKLQRDKLHSLLAGGSRDGRSFDGMGRTSLALSAMSRKMKAGSGDLAALREAGAKARGLIGALDRLKLALRVLARGGRLEGAEIPGLDTAGSGLAQLQAGAAEIRKGVSGAGGQTGLLDKLRAGLALLRTALKVLLTGGEIEGQQVPGLDTAGRGLGEVGDGLRQVADGLAQSKDGAVMLRDGVGQAYDQGIKPLHTGVGAALAELGQAEALKRAAAEKVRAYDHFIGKPAGATGEVRFLLRTEGLR